MSKANPVTKLGLMELARLTHEHLDNHPGVIPTATVLLHKVADHRIYGRFRGLEVVNKIRTRRWKRLQMLRRRPSDLVTRLRNWRSKRALALFQTVFPMVPSGGTHLYIQWKTDQFTFHSSSHKSGYYNHRTTTVNLNLRLHPHWHRRLGAVCQKMNRFFLDICDRLVPVAGAVPKVVLWGLEVRKSRGYTFRCAWVVFTPREIKENALDRLEPWQTDGLLGLDRLTVPVPAVSGAAASG